MSKTKSSTNRITLVIIGLLGLVLIIIISIGVSYLNRQQKEKACQNDGKIIDKPSGVCREKTISERFDENCFGDMVYVVDGQTITCSEIKKLGLEKAFLDNKIVKHGNKLYERGTTVEIAAGKQVGDYCLSAKDSWSHIGEVRCVVFRYEYLACSNGYCFLDEKKDYKSGFIAFFGRYNMYNWESFSAEYKSGVSNVLVCGQIYSYQGHPEIKVTDVGKQVVKNPTMKDGAYQYSCK